MLKKDLLNLCVVDDQDIEQVINAHPLQIISKVLYVPVWKVEYSYTTKRENQKTAVKYMFLYEYDWDIAEREFNSYINEFNKLHPDRPISNVEILDIDYIGKMFIELE